MAIYYKVVAVFVVFGSKRHNMMEMRAAMINNQQSVRALAVRAAVTDAINDIGLSAFRETSFFRQNLAKSRDYAVKQAA